MDIIGGDPRYVVYSLPSDISDIRSLGLDLAIRAGSLLRTNGDKGAAAQKSFERDYQAYQDHIYRQQTDLFAAYPVWIKSEYIVSELDFLATQSGQHLAAPRQAYLTPPEPENIVTDAIPPSRISQAEMEDLRIQLEEEAARGSDRAGQVYRPVIPAGGSWS